MDAPMKMDELAARMPLNQFIPITDAAKILGGGSSRINALMDAVQTSRLACWSHGTEESALCTTINGEEKWAPNITPDTDPATVLLDAEDVLRQWCGELENVLLGVSSKELAPYIEARLAKLKARAIALKTESNPAPQSAPTKPKRRRDLLAPLIEAAQRECMPSDDVPAIFAVLRAWATSKPPRPPLLGVTNSGIQWIDASDDQQELSLKNLRDRIKRAKTR